MSEVWGRTLADAVQAMEDIAPLAGASSWDNVGLLVEARPDAQVGQILLCIDLTEAVMDEALTAGADLIIAYHPPLFGGVKRLTQAVPLQRSILRSILEGVAIYSPHTALDAATGGVCDWLAEGLGAFVSAEPIEPACPPASPDVGAGRVLQLDRSCSLSALVTQLKAHLGLDAVRVARHPRHIDGAETIRTVALCPGAGGGLFEAVGDVDLFVTGEMRHHDVLARVAMGAAVILTDHSHSERGYLPVLAKRLREALGDGVGVRVSQADQEPLQVC